MTVVLTTHDCQHLTHILCCHSRDPEADLLSGKHERQLTQHAACCAFICRQTLLCSGLVYWLFLSQIPEIWLFLTLFGRENLIWLKPIIWPFLAFLHFYDRLTLLL